MVFIHPDTCLTINCGRATFGLDYQHAIVGLGLDNKLEI